jgi:hypothetical protein
MRRIPTTTCIVNGLLDALNDAAEQAIAGEDVVGSRFGKPAAFIDTRRPMISATVALGRGADR